MYVLASFMLENFHSRCIRKNMLASQFQSNPAAESRLASTVAPCCSTRYTPWHSNTANIHEHFCTTILLPRSASESGCHSSAQSEGPEVVEQVQCSVRSCSRVMNINMTGLSARSRLSGIVPCPPSLQVSVVSGRAQQLHLVKRRSLTINCQSRSSPDSLLGTELQRQDTPDLDALLQV